MGDGSQNFLVLPPQTNHAFAVSKRPGILIAASSLVLLTGLVWEIRHLHEPAYDGTPLTSWLEQYSTNHFVRPRSAADKEAETAIRQIGTIISL